jgi:hypothetical protein
MRLVEFSKGAESSGGPLTCTVTFLADGRSMTVVPNKSGGNQGGPAAPSSPDDDAARISSSTGGGPGQAAPPAGEDSPD